MSDDKAISKEREALVHSHLGLATAIALRIANARGRHADREDLISFGRLGLVMAATRFCKSRGVRFVTYAYPRIYGAIIDGMAKLCPMSRGYYRGGGSDYVFHNLDDKELAAPNHEPGADELIQRSEKNSQLYALLATLPSKSRVLLFEFYFADIPLSQTAERLGHSKSWASRRHKKALGHLAEAFGSLGEQGQTQAA